MMTQDTLAERLILPIDQDFQKELLATVLDVFIDDIIFQPEQQITNWAMDPPWVEFNGNFMSFNLRAWCVQAGINWKYTISYDSHNRRSYRFLFDAPSAVTAVIMKVGINIS